MIPNRKFTLWIIRCMNKPALQTNAMGRFELMKAVIVTKERRRKSIVEKDHRKKYRVDRD